MKDDEFDVILLDMTFERDLSSGQEGFFWLSKILSIDPQAVVVLITAYGDIGLAVRAIKEGASDFVLKPWQNEKLLATVSAAMNLRSSRFEAESLRRRQQQLSADLDHPLRDVDIAIPADADIGRKLFFPGGQTGQQGLGIVLPPRKTMQ